MIEPIRYSEVSNDWNGEAAGLAPSADGEYVRYEDYAALLEKVRKIASEVIKERKSAEDWHARMSEDYDNGSALGQDVVAASEALQAWEKAEELLKDFKTQEGKPSA